MGNYHIAKIKVIAVPIKDKDGVIQRFELEAEELHNINSVAKLDLTGETTLRGTASELQSFTLLWNTSTNTFDEIIECVPGATIDVRGNAGKKSLITLLPTRESVTLECSKGKYEFTEGIKSNQVYLGGKGESIEDALPLKWSNTE